MKSIHILLIVTICMLSKESTARAQIQIPESPAQDGQGEFTQDYAGAINYEQDLQRIAAAQKKAFEKYDTPIIVVVITRMSSYGYYNSGIESFATQWFNEWEIGTEGANGKNQGILLLVSIGDRKARIELGKDWGRKFDNHCQSIMDDVIIPQFKRGDYSAGITEGAEALLKMASIGPNGPINKFTPPKSKSGITFSGGSKGGIWFSWGIRLFLFALGGLAIFAGVKVEPESYLEKLLYCVGFACIVMGIAPVGIFLAVILIFIGVIPDSVLKAMSSGSGGYSSSSYSSSSYSSSYSGGGFGGGSSGGGGASGSW